ncbi:hypothetical protein [Pseudoduganella sp.]|uniref:hypothetical protein n=1 Tax=Pseudoduganella sp. TaxID=1880898 RepID=UPI0035B360F6
MKRMERDPLKFAALENYTAIGRKKGLRLNDPQGMETFASVMMESLQGAQAKPTMLHGKRTEALFAYVAGALGNCAVIKTEDSGEVFSAGGEIQAPDYRLILNDGTRMLVEVKNFRAKDMVKPFKLKIDAFEKLERYAKFDGTELKIAVYFSSFGRWALLSPKAFVRSDDCLEITMASALAKSEMATLGDVHLATIPDLRLELMGNPEEANPLKGGEAVITFRSAKMHAGGIALADQACQQIAFYLMRYGRWEMTSHAVIEDGKLQGVVLTSSAENLSEGQPFVFIGELSSMISAAFAEHTVEDGKVSALDIDLDPDAFSPGIPKDLKGLELPLWAFIMQPNYDFEDNFTAQFKGRK